MSHFFLTVCPAGYDFIGNPFLVNEYYEDLFDMDDEYDHINNFDKTCYRDETTALTFEAAEANCNADNGYLVEPQNERYLEWIASEITYQYSQTIPQFWLGIKKVNGQ